MVIFNIQTELNFDLIKEFIVNFVKRCEFDFDVVVNKSFDDEDKETYITIECDDKYNQDAYLILFYCYGIIDVMEAYDI